MASAGRIHQLVSKHLVRNWKTIKTAWKQTQTTLESRFASGARLEPIPVRARQPLHPVAALKQSRARWYSTSSQRYFSTSRCAAKSSVTPKSAWPQSATRSAVASLPGRAPFASTLRPNLTGGAFPRTAGGYSLGSGRTGGARHFSHTPAAPAQVVQNVSQAVRAFLLGGQKAQFDGTDPGTGNKRYRAVTALQESASKKMQSLPKMTPGSYVDFVVNPTITALTPLEAVAGYAGLSLEDTVRENGKQTHINEFDMNLNTPSLLSVLSADFSRALKDLAAVLNDLKALASLGDLRITYDNEHGLSKLRIHFPGCDLDTVETLCSELGVKRGVVVQDEEFDSFAGTEIALLFPFAPSDEGSRPTSRDGLADRQPSARFRKPTLKREDAFVFRDDPFCDTNEVQSEEESDSEAYAGKDHYSLVSNTGEEFFDLQGAEEVDLSSASPDLGYGSWTPTSSHKRSPSLEEASSPLEYQDFEGIYRFIEMCDDSRRT